MSGNQDFFINAVDITITTPIIFPLSLPLPAELQQYISIIQLLESQRRLERFIIFLIFVHRFVIDVLKEDKFSEWETFVTHLEMTQNI